MKPRALWQVFACDTISVLLIDEIDKAPRDFPNDLLEELDQYRFKHPFKEEYIPAHQPRHRPIVIITSNVERRLPDAFLRRCVFHYIELTPEHIRTVVQARLGDFPHLADEVREQALRCFWRLREDERISKKPSTAELLVWLAVLSTAAPRVTQLDPDNLGELFGSPCSLKTKMTSGACVDNFKPLATFLEELQGAGIPVGIRELDWLKRIFALQPALDRQGLREVLRCTLIKTPQHRQRFDDLFEAMYPLELPEPSIDEARTDASASGKFQEGSEEPVTATTSTQTAMLRSTSAEQKSARLHLPLPPQTRATPGVAQDRPGRSRRERAGGFLLVCAATPPALIPACR